MRVAEVMTSPVQTISASTKADDAWTTMRDKRIHHLVVLDGREIAGVVSERDLGGRRGAATRANHTVGDLMTTAVVTAEPDTTVRRAADLMRGRSIGCLVVVSGRKVAGIVTTADLLVLLARGGDRQFVAPKRWTLKHRAPHKKRHVAYGVW
jgi:CBS domain-containing protein